MKKILIVFALICFSIFLFSKNTNSCASSSVKNDCSEVSVSIETTNNVFSSSDMGLFAYCGGTNKVQYGKKIFFEFVYKEGETLKTCKNKNNNLIKFPKIEDYNGLKPQKIVGFEKVYTPVDTMLNEKMQTYFIPSNFIRQNDKYFIFYKGLTKNVQIYDLETFKLANYIYFTMEKESVINDIYLSDKKIYVLNNIKREVSSFDFSGKFLEKYKLFGDVRSFAVDEKNKLFLLNMNLDSNIVFWNFNLGKVVKVLSIGKTKNEQLNKLYFRRFLILNSDKYYFFVSKFTNNVYFYDKLQKKISKRIKICPESLKKREKNLNETIENGLGEKEGILQWSRNCFIYKKKLTIFNFNYVTEVNLKDFSVKFNLLKDKEREFPAYLNYFKRNKLNYFFIANRENNYHVFAF